MYRTDSFSEIAQLESVGEEPSNGSLQDETEVTSCNGDGERTVFSLRENITSDFEIALTSSRDVDSMPPKTVETISMQTELPEKIEVTACNESHETTIANMEDNISDFGSNKKGVGLNFLKSVVMISMQRESSEEKMEVTSCNESHEMTVADVKDDATFNFGMASSTGEDVCIHRPETVDGGSHGVSSNKKAKDKADVVSWEENGALVVSDLRDNIMSNFRTASSNGENVGTIPLETAKMKWMRSESSEEKAGVMSCDKSYESIVASVGKHIASDFGKVLNNCKDVGVSLRITAEVGLSNKRTEDRREVTSCEENGVTTVSNLQDNVTSDCEMGVNNNKDVGISFSVTSEIGLSNERKEDRTEVSSCEENDATAVSNLQDNDASDFEMGVNNNGDVGISFSVTSEVGLSNKRTDDRTEVTSCEENDVTTVSNLQDNVVSDFEVGVNNNKDVCICPPVTAEAGLSNKRTEDRTKVTSCEENDATTVSNLQDSVTSDSNALSNSRIVSGIPKTTEVESLQAELLNENPKDETEVISCEASHKMADFDMQKNVISDSGFAFNNSEEVGAIKVLQGETLSGSLETASEVTSRTMSDTMTVSCSQDNVSSFKITSCNKEGVYNSLSKTVEVASLEEESSMRLEDEIGGTSCAESDATITDQILTKSLQDVGPNFGVVLNTSKQMDASFPQTMIVELRRGESSETGLNYETRGTLCLNAVVEFQTTRQTSHEVYPFLSDIAENGSGSEESPHGTVRDETEVAFCRYDAAEIEQTRLIIGGVKIKEEEEKESGVSVELMEPSSGSVEYQSFKQEVELKINCGSIKEEFSLSDCEICFEDGSPLFPSTSRSVNAQVAECDFLGFDESEIERACLLTLRDIEVEEGDDFLGFDELEIEQARLLIFGGLRTKEEEDFGVTQEVSEYSRDDTAYENQQVPQNVKQEYDCGSIKEEYFYSDQEICFDHTSLVPLYNAPIINETDNSWNESQTQSEVSCGSDGVKPRHARVELEDLFPSHVRELGKAHTNTGSCLCVYCQGEYSGVSQCFLETSGSSTQPHSQNLNESKKQPEDHQGSDLEIHQEPRSVFQCEKCSAKFKGKAALNAHFRRHVREQPHTCKWCHERFALLSSLRAHWKVHNLERPWKCEYCPMEFWHQSVLVAHLRVHTKEKPFECKQCSATFSQHSTLKSHLKKHTVEKPYRCVHCPAAFRWKSNLTVHWRVHSGEKPFKCAHCPMKFMTSTNLKLHLRTHSDEKPFECTQCPAKFKKSGLLKVHSRVHSGEKPYKCQLCPLRFAQCSSRISHFRNIHSDVRSFECKLCPQKCKTKTALNTHMRVHSSEKPYKCKLCPLRFAQCSTRKTHFQNIHSDLRPFECKLCPEKRKTKTALNTHMRIHTGEKPYKCTLCSGQFGNKSTLNAHLRRHGSENPYSCAHCSITYKKKSKLLYHLKQCH